MKKNIYIGLFVILGFLVQAIVHAAAEWVYIGLLIRDFDTWGLGFGWDTWYLIHHIGSVILVILGLWIGYRQGQYWWKRV